jgi:hypothetical protein
MCSGSDSSKQGGPAPSWAAGVARDGTDERSVSNGSGWTYKMYNQWLPGSQNGNPGYTDPAAGAKIDVPVKVVLPRAAATLDHYVCSS